MLTGLLALCVLLLVTCAGAQWILSARAMRVPANGRVIAAGPFRLYTEVLIRGPGPVVVLEHGGSVVGRTWHSVQLDLAEKLGGTVIAYDRPGFGWSTPAPGLYRIADEVQALDALLTALDIAEPVILVGHSYGGFTSRAFEAAHPERVAGLVLVDPNTPEFFQAHPEAIRNTARFGKMLSVAGPLGIVRAAQVTGLGFDDAGFRDFPNWDETLSVMLATRHLRSSAAMVREFATTVNTVAGLPPPQHPVVVISRGMRDAQPPWVTDVHEASWRAGHAALVESAPKGVLRTAEHSKHFVIVTEPEIVAEGVEELIRLLGS